MRAFDYSQLPPDVMSHDIGRLLSAIHEFRGKQSLYQATRPETLDALRAVAKIQSTAASNRIEGIYTSDKRLPGLIAEKLSPENRAEQEILGYRNVLATIHESHDHIPLTPGIILQLHRDLLRPTGLSIGGHWKDSDNVIAEVGTDGVMRPRFVPTPASETPRAVEALCTSYADAIRADQYDPLLLIPLVIFDFVSIHPFNDGNGRMSRLLTLLLLYKNGYEVGKYVSIENEIERTKESYYESLALSSAGWHEGKNRYAPFVEYLLGVILSTYRDLDEMVASAEGADFSKGARIKRCLKNQVKPISKSELHELNPDISLVTIGRTLRALLEKGTIEKLGAARATKYRWVGR